MRRLVRLSICGALLALLLVAQPRAAARRSPGSSRRAPFDEVHSAKTGAVVYDLQTGQVVFALHATRSLHPASNEKLGDDVRGAHRTWAVVPDRDGRARRRNTRRHDMARRHRPQGLRRPDPLRSRSVVARAAGRTRRHHARSTGRVIGDESWFDTRRAAPAGSASSTSTSRRRLGAHRRPRLERARGVGARALRGAALSPLPCRRGRVGPRTGADRSCARERDGARLRRLPAASVARPLHGHEATTSRPRCS